MSSQSDGICFSKLDFQMGGGLWRHDDGGFDMIMALPPSYMA